jgi:hypothetical protein
MVVVKSYVAAIVDLWSFQKSKGLNSHPNPHGEALNGVLRARARGEHRRRRLKFADRAAGTLQDGYDEAKMVDVHGGVRETPQTLQPNLPQATALNTQDRYVYGPLDSSRHEIRLLSLHPSANSDSEIRCTLSTASLDETPEYYALSYVWGNLQPTVPARIDQDMMDITRNLWMALKYLRLENTVRTLWVDAICINQSNISERNEQVCQVGKIFERAAEVIIWLGEENDDSDLAINLIKSWGETMCWHNWFNIINSEIPSMERDGEMSREEAIDLANTIKTARPKLYDWDHPMAEWLQEISSPFDPKAWVALKCLFQRQWWRRIWVYQEIVLAKKATIFCGTCQVDWNLLYWAIQAWDEISDPELVLLKIMERDDLLAVRGSDYEVARLMSYHHRGWTDDRAKLLDLEVLLDLTREFQSTDPRDKIYALLGVYYDETVTIQPQYEKPVGFVYSEAIRALIEGKQDLSILCRLGAGIGYNGTTETKLPSWVPDFTASDYSASYTKRSRNYRASGSAKASVHFSADIQILEAQGILFDTIHEIHNLSDNSQLCYYRWEHWLRRYMHHTHPTGIPQIQALFRTMIADDSCFGYDDPEFRNEDRTNKFVDLAVGFLYLIGEESLRQGSYANASQLVSEGLTESRETNDYAKMFARWIGMTPGTQPEQTLLEPFLGSPQSEVHLHWPAITDRNKGYNGCFQFAWEEDRICRGARFFITEKGYIGLAPPSAQEADMVCVLLGCDMPSVIRKTGEFNLLLGSCYCYGMMNGEVIKDATDGRPHFENIKLR